MTPRRTTSRSGGGSRIRLRLIAAAALLWLIPPAGARPDPPQAQPDGAPYAVVAGSVFQDDGRTLRGAQVTLRPDPESGPPPKGKPVTVTTDRRGEFAFRLPAGPMRYNVSVKALGFRAQAKAVLVSGDERVEVYFQLERDRPAK